MFDMVHDHGGSTALYSGTPKLDFLDRSWNATNGAVDTTGVDNGRDKIDTYLRGAGRSPPPTRWWRGSPANPETFSFIHTGGRRLGRPPYGFMSSQYLDAVTGRRRPHRRDPRRGGGRARARREHRRDRRRPTTAALGTQPRGPDRWPTTTASRSSPGARACTPGADLYALNPDRANPGPSQPAYTAPLQPIRNGDVANLVTELLGLRPSPGSTINADQSLDLGPGV